MPPVHETLIAVCNIARDFPTSSLKALIDRSGYRMHRQEITKDAIEEHVRANQQLIDEWLRYSEDKRTSGGWYLDVRGPFVVGALRTGERKQFDDRAEACAAFIKNEVETWASVDDARKTATGD
ncbi:hypothetical protein DES53_10845 [Roseimicrobium gellanilyticum]|uniref:Uncharacterized protein n=1 Tax=Roseimicrobium gellanilyticum TaxID=748857 RepID=A0A366HEI6_9BACT|nr:hypothetical protein [Roseimicrobium gellanilyticum]RBP40339.1 hypothetical protein DES53_10845 [Roseimicrobium gellanilyticum]